MFDTINTIYYYYYFIQIACRMISPKFKKNSTNLNHRLKWRFGLKICMELIPWWALHSRRSKQRFMIRSWSSKTQFRIALNWWFRNCQMRSEQHLVDVYVLSLSSTAIYFLNFKFWNMKCFFIFRWVCIRLFATKLQSLSQNSSTQIQNDAPIAFWNWLTYNQNTWMPNAMDSTKKGLFNGLIWYI